MTAKNKPRITMRGSVGLLLDVLTTEQIEHYKRRLTVHSIPFKDQAPTTVHGFHESEGYLWIPRYFDRMQFWPTIKHWEWTSPHLDYQFQQLMTPDPSRNQPQSIEALTNELTENSATIGVLPTGTGKTLIALSIAAKFQTPIAVFVYAGHMIDNWVEHARTVLGVPREDVGLVKEGRCDIGKPITIISIQTVLSRELPEELYRQIGFIIADEIHHYAARAWGQVVAKFPARFRLGMSANPLRKDGLDPIIRWHFGKVGFAVHKREAGELPLVCMVRFPSTYKERSYYDLKRSGGRWVIDTPNSMKYDKQLMSDRARNEWLVGRIIEARSKGRRILVFATLRDHVEMLHDAFKLEWAKLKESLPDDETSIALLWGSLKPLERARAMKSDVIFTTHSFSREALNVTHIDTLFFATPPGDPLQPVGRLRDKGAADRKSLLVFDVYENVDYSFRKAMKRKVIYQNLGLEVRRMARK